MKTELVASFENIGNYRALASQAVSKTANSSSHSLPNPYLFLNACLRLRCIVGGIFCVRAKYGNAQKAMARDCRDAADLLRFTRSAFSG